MLPFSLTQNPAPNPSSEGQDYQAQKTALVQEIMDTFRSVLPSNWVARTNGPWYSLQFQAMAEQLADIQLSGTEVYKDSGWDFTRTDFLWQVLGSMVFPEATDQSGIPQIDGDVAYRAFLKKMVGFLLEGATKSSMVGGLEALDGGLTVTIAERYLESPPRDPTGAYTIDDQFFVDIFVEGFPADPIQYQESARLVLSALKPAHVLYGFSYLFRDAFDKIADDTGGFSFDLNAYYYEDLRKWCLGAERISGTGDTLANRFLFSDPDVSFRSVRAGALLKIPSGANAGAYKVSQVIALPYGADATSRAYTLSSGGGGTVKAQDGETLEDPTRDWGLLEVDEQITILAGPNAGTYRLETVLGNGGGPVGQAGVTGTQVRVSPSILKLKTRMPATLTGQSYEVGVDRLGVQVPRVITGEDVTLQFTL